MTDISDDNYLCLMSDNGDLREDLKIPDGEIGQQLKAEYDNGKELLVSSIEYHLALNMCGLFLLKIIFLVLF